VTFHCFLITISSFWSLTTCSSIGLNVAIVLNPICNKVIVTFAVAFYTREFATQILLAVGSHPQTSKLRRSIQKLFAVCAPEAFIFQKLSPFSSGSIEVFLKDRIFLTRLHKPGSISAFRSRSKGPMLFFSSSLHWNFRRRSLKELSPIAQSLH
jgi:hypothetical protein